MQVLRILIMFILFPVILFISLYNIIKIYKKCKVIDLIKDKYISQLEGELADIHLGHLFTNTN